MAIKKRCPFINSEGKPCTHGIMRIVGMCAACGKAFCGDHRLPEQHSCAKLEDCRQQAFERNKAKLEEERTVAPKLVM